MRPSGSASSVSIFDVRHQTRAQRIVQRALAGDRMPHAYIFHGPDGVGKERFAAGLAGGLLCANPVQADVSGIPELSEWDGPTRDACGRCEDCRAVQAETHPDLHRVYRQLGKYHPDPTVRSRKALDLGVDVVRHFVIDCVGSKPARGRAKVFIVREADRITTAAQNALLKTLEEPPPTTVLVLLASSLERLLPTIHSRCQLISFSPLPHEFVARRLRELRPELSATHAEFCGSIAQGSLGDALLYADDGVVDYYERVAAALGSVASGGATETAKEWIEAAKTLGGFYRKRDPDVSDTEAQRQGLKVLLALASTWYRQGLHEAVGSTLAGSGHATASLTPESAAGAIAAISAAERRLDLNANVQLCLETMFFELARQRDPRIAKR